MLILRPDFSWTPVEDLRVGDAVLGRTAPDKGKQGVLTESIVTATSRRIAPLVRVNGNLTCSADKRFWVAQNPNAHSGWREVTRCEGLNVAFLTDPPKRDQAEYEHGYLAGLADGDGCFWTLRKGGREYRRFRLAVNDTGLLDRARGYADHAGFTLRPGSHGTTGFSGDRRDMDCLWLTVDSEAARFEEWCASDPGTESWAWGYLAGIFDAEGTIGKSGGVVRIAQYPDVNGPTYERIAATANRCGFTITREPKAVRLAAGGGELWRFLAGATPAKRSALATVLGRAPHRARRIESVEGVGEGEVVSLTTSTGNYFAEGWLVHNCDTQYTWNAERYDLREELTRVPVADILAKVDAMNVPLIIISGGEPLLHQTQPAWANLMIGLSSRGIEVHVETNGTRTPTLPTRAAVGRYIVSPKLAHAGDPEHKRIRPDALRALRDTGSAVFKFVATGAADLDEVAALAESVGIPDRLIWIMPEGVTPEAVVAGGAAIGDAVIERGWNLTTRLHVLCWPKERAR